MDATLTLTQKQIEAVQLCTDLSKRLVAVSGEPGTGKTTIIKHVYDTLVAAGYRVAISAPTGKAAKRIKEATGIDAMTNHRLLEYPHPGERDPKTGKALRSTDPQRHKQYPLEYDVVICDEFMMVNREVFQNIVNALPSGGCLRCFGDENQLPPIEKEVYRTAQQRATQQRATQQKKDNKPVAPFKEVLERFTGVRLDQVHRQAEGSTIISNAKLILSKRMPRRGDDFDIQFTDLPIQTLRSIIEHRDIDYGSLANQIITPTKKTWVGTRELNAMLQPMLNGQYRKTKFTVPERHSWAGTEAEQIELYVGDKVLWADNNDYKLEVFNGETGVISEIDEEVGIVYIDFGDREVAIPPVMQAERPDGTQIIYNPQKNIELAYAITTHKAQGSEYDNIVYVLNRSSYYTHSRPNFYTAITRAKQKVTLITDQRSISSSLFKDAQ